MFEQKIDVESLKKLQWKIMQNVAAGAIIPLMRIGDELGSVSYTHLTLPTICSV